jgi:hypothetical protein
MKVIRHFQPMRNQEKTVLIDWINGYNGNTANDCGNALVGHDVEQIPQRPINSYQVSIAWMN